MVGTSIMAKICISPYSSPYPTEKVRDSPYPTAEKFGDSPYPYPYPVNAGILIKMGTGSSNTHGDGFICHL